MPHRRVGSLGWEGAGAQVGHQLSRNLECPSKSLAALGLWELLLGHCGEVTRCKGFSRKLLAADTPHAKGHRWGGACWTCWNPDRT